MKQASDYPKLEFGCILRRAYFFTLHRYARYYFRTLSRTLLFARGAEGEIRFLIV
jgi:hypothetical protein